MLLKNDEIARLKTKSEYDDQLNDWNIPPFVLRAKEINFPKVNGKRIMAQEKDERDLSI